MRSSHVYCKRPTWLGVLVLSALTIACGGKDPILGSDGLAGHPPTVTAESPSDNSLDVPISNTTISATFSEPVAAGMGFTVTCNAPCVSPQGTFARDTTNTTASYTPTGSAPLAPQTLYTATVTGATSLATGLALASPFVWRFTTGVAPTPPTVSAVAPANGATGVATNVAAVIAGFSEAMSPITGNASFVLTCAAPCVSPAGTVSLDATNTVAYFTLTPGVPLRPLTLYTATVSDAVSAVTGLTLTNPFVWQFTTGATADTSRPRVTLTLPATTSPGPTTGVPVNTAITAAFTEDMLATTLNANTFTVTCASPCMSPTGTVSYQIGARTAVFTPATTLTVGSTYTASINTGATDLAANALAGNQAPFPAASDYVWTFSTVAAAPAANLTVISTNPAANEMGVCPGAAINATFNVPSGLRLNANTVSTATFTLTGPSPALTPVSAASVTVDPATGTIATFLPQSPLTPGGTYAATIRGGSLGVKDLAVPANSMLTNFPWTFTVGPATGNCLAPVPLGSISPFGTFGGTAGSTNTGILTMINGDLGTVATATSSITGFHDTAGDVYTETTANIGTVNGTIYSCTHSTTGPTATGPNVAHCGIATQALLDGQAAYLALTSLPPGANPGGNLAGLTLTPGVYTAAAGTFRIQGADLTLDAQGNANAVWVFQMATTLTVGGPGAAAPQSIILAGGAQAKNVFWQVGSAATINAGGGGTMVGTILSQAGAAFSTAGNTNVLTLEGRALSLGASVTVVNTVINVPAP